MTLLFNLLAVLLYALAAINATITILLLTGHQVRGVRSAGTHLALALLALLVAWLVSP